MNKRNTRLVVIPARGGSKRLKNKNILPIDGKPLVAHAIEIAQKSNLFDKILLSTDSPRIAAVGKERGAEIYKRPKKFASDSVGVMPALAELLDTLEEKGEIYDVVCQMLPTCLFRKVEHLQVGAKKLDKSVDSVISVSEYDFPVKKALRLKKDKLELFFEDSPWKSGTARTQDQEIFYHDNGAFYFSWWKSFKKYRNFFLGKMKGVIVPRLNAFDIDTEQDLITAQLLFNYAKKQDSKNVFKMIVKSKKNEV